MSSTKIVSLLIGVVVTGLTARYLGVESFGVLALGISFVNLFNVLFSMGNPHLLSAKFVSHPRSSISLLGASVIVRSMFFVLIYPIIIVIFWVYYQEYFWFLVLSTCGCLFFTLDSFEVYFDAKRQSKFEAVPKMIAKIISETYRVCLIQANSTLLLFALFLPIWYGLTLIFRLIIFFRNETKIRIRRLYTLIRYVLKSCLPLTISSMSIVVYTQTDRIMIENILGTKDLGIYAAAATISHAWLIVPTSVVISLLPNMVSTLRNNNAINRGELDSFFRIIFLLTVSIGFTIYMLSDYIIFIVFGEEFEYAADLMNVMLISACFSIYGLAANRILIALEYRKYCMYKAMLAAILNVIANLILINEFGVIGAVFATLIAELTSSLVMNFFVHNKTIGKSQVKGMFTILSGTSYYDLKAFIKGKPN
jgi:O-antigen/teichoic acid export membrane protein